MTPLWRRKTGWRSIKTETVGFQWNTPVRLKLANSKRMRGLFRSMTGRWEDLNGNEIMPLVTHWSPIE